MLEFKGFSGPHWRADGCQSTSGHHPCPGHQDFELSGSPWEACGHDAKRTSRLHSCELRRAEPSICPRRWSGSDSELASTRVGREKLPRSLWSPFHVRCRTCSPRAQPEPICCARAISTLACRMCARRSAMLPGRRPGRRSPDLEGCTRSGVHLLYGLASSLFDLRRVTHASYDRSFRSAAVPIKLRRWSESRRPPRSVKRAAGGECCPACPSARAARLRREPAPARSSPCAPRIPQDRYGEWIVAFTQWPCSGVSGHRPWRPSGAER